jgi:hypothetical protein
LKRLPGFRFDAKAQLAHFAEREEALGLNTLAGKEASPG